MLSRDVPTNTCPGVRPPPMPGTSISPIPFSGSFCTLGAGEAPGQASLTLCGCQVFLET